MHDYKRLNCWGLFATKSSSLRSWLKDTKSAPVLPPRYLRSLSSSICTLLSKLDLGAIPCFSSPLSLVIII